MPNPDDAPKPRPIPDWLKEICTPRPKCALHNEPQPCRFCLLVPRPQTPKESPVPIGYPTEDERGDQSGVE